ncbi:MAG: LysM domain-containing protein [Patescibacteria group bacterium]
MTRMQHRARRYGYRMKRRFRQDPFSTIVLYSILLGLFFTAFAFRGMLFTMFVKPIGIINPSNDSVKPEPVETDATGQTGEAVTFKSSGTYIVKPGDTLSIIAGELNLDWKELAEFNDLKPPYSLNVGDELKLP